MSIRATVDTFLKALPIQSSAQDFVYVVREGDIIPTGSIETSKSNPDHYLITMYAYKDHFKVIDQPKEEDDDDDEVNETEQPRSISESGLEMLKGHEGLRLKSYKDSAGVWTIGYGHTGEDVSPGMKITRNRATKLLKMDLKRFEEAVIKNVEVPLNQNQFDALVSFSFNVGVNAFKNSTLLEELNKGNYKEAENEFMCWVYAGGRRLQGLVNRREEESALFGKKAIA